MALMESLSKLTGTPRPWGHLKGFRRGRSVLTCSSSGARDDVWLAPCCLTVSKGTDEPVLIHPPHSFPFPKPHALQAKPVNRGSSVMRLLGHGQVAAPDAES